MMLAFAFSQAGEMHLLPQLPLHGIYLVFIAGFLLTIPWLRWLPAFPHVPQPSPFAPGIKGPEQATGSATNHLFPNDLPQIRLPAPWLPWLSLIAVFFTYSSIGAYWTYIELSALRAGIAESWIVPLLTWVSLGSILGCIVAMLVSDRFGLSRPLLVSLIILALTVGLLGIEINQNNLLISLLFFNWLWIFIDVYQMSTAAVMDQTGKFASLLPASQGLGQIIGPNVAAGMLDSGMPYEWIFLMCMGMILTGALVYLFMYLRLRHQIPALARHVG
jgi:predicted MFS family arabinose efflux permease